MTASKAAARFFSSRQLMATESPGVEPMQVTIHVAPPVPLTEPSVAALLADLQAQEPVYVPVPTRTDKVRNGVLHVIVVEGRKGVL